MRETSRSGHWLIKSDGHRAHGKIVKDIAPEDPKTLMLINLIDNLPAKHAYLGCRGIKLRQICRNLGPRWHIAVSLEGHLHYEFLGARRTPRDDERRAAAPDQLSSFTRFGQVPWVNARYLLDAVRWTKTTEIHFSSELDPIVLRSATRFAIIMPVRR